MRVQLTQGELEKFTPSEPGLYAHCVRVSTLSSEIGRATGIPLRSALALQQAAMMHHAPELGINNATLDRLMADLMEKSPTAPKQLELPETLASTLKAFRQFPGSIGDAAGETLAQILVLANWIDEHIEGANIDGSACEALWEALEPVREMFSQKLWSAARALFPAAANTSNRTWEIPVQPDVAQELIGLLRHTASYSLTRLSSIAGRDPAIACKLIEAANSPLFHARMRIRTVHHALAYLGENASRKIVTALIARSMFGSSGTLRQLWQHSLKAAHFLENMARVKGFMDPAEALLTGLVHDLGRIAIVRQKESAMHARLTQSGCASNWAETLLFGVDHAELGARILESWRFPEHVVEAVRFHHRPAENNSPVAAALYTAEFWMESDEDLPSSRQLRTALNRIDCGLHELSAFDGIDAAVEALLKIA